MDAKHVCGRTAGPVSGFPAEALVLSFGLVEASIAVMRDSTLAINSRAIVLVKYNLRMHPGIPVPRRDAYFG